MLELKALNLKIAVSEKQIEQTFNATSNNALPPKYIRLQSSMKDELRNACLF